MKRRRKSGIAPGISEIRGNTMQRLCHLPHSPHGTKGRLEQMPFWKRQAAGVSAERSMKRGVSVYYIIILYYYLFIMQGT